MALEGLKVNLHQLLRAMIEKGASDMHITTGSPPLLRIDGAIVPLKLPPLSPVETKQLCYSVLTEEQKITVREEQRARPVVRREEPVALPRQHLHAARRRRRRVPLDSVQDPDLRRARSAAGRRRAGLQAPRSGAGHRPHRLAASRTTLASIIDKINSETRQHIITIEDPIEYLHPHKRCIVNQREVGTDTDELQGRAQVRAAPGSRTSCWSARCVTSRRSRRR